jgi:hypothetical protein
MMKGKDNISSTSRGGEMMERGERNLKNVAHWRILKISWLKEAPRCGDGRVFLAQQNPLQ